MPIFVAIGAAIAEYALAAGFIAAGAVAAVTAIGAIGAAYITSRVLNGNPNKGNNSARNEGGRIQVPPATNNKIPVVYGSAYVNGIITDARLITLEQKINDRMYYCIVLSEFTKTAGTSFGLESVLWNDLRLTALPGMESHIVKDGRKVVNGAIVNAGSFVVDKTYVITKIGNTDFTLIGAATNNIGQIFTATGVGTPGQTGRAQEEDFIDTNFIDGTNQYVQMRVYAGGSDKTQQIYPPQAGGNTANAYNFWGSGPLDPNGDGSWDSTYQMDGLVFAIVSVRYSGDKGFTGLPNMTFQLANNVANPADVWLDYMTSERYGAGIPSAAIDETARLAWYNFCEEDISYTNVAGEINQSTVRYNINGVIDTGNQVKTNIDTILQNGGAWMSYNVATGLWSPIIKKAVSAGDPFSNPPIYFTASRTGSTLTVTVFPAGRIEVGQRLYNSSGTFIGTITAQLAPTAGETTGQIGRYTTSSSGSITTTTFYTLPASTLEFNDDNIISGINLSSTRLEDLYNNVEAEFYDKYNKDQKAYSRTVLPDVDRNPNEPDNQLRMSFDFVNNSMQADLLSQLEMRQSRDDLVIDFTTNQYGIQTQAGDIIAVTTELYDWAPKYFRVMRVKEIEGDDASLTAQIQALEYNPDVYTIEPITEFTTSSNIGIGVWGASPNLPPPPSVIIAAVDADAPIPNFQLQIGIPVSGGPFDEIELYYTEGWDEHGINGKIVPGQVTVTNATGNGSTATLTFATQTFTPYDVGQVVTIAGLTPSGYNGVKTITGATTSTISYASTTTGFTTGGTITNAAGAGLGLLTVTNTTYGNINPGDRIDLPSDIYIVSQLTNTVGPKTFSSGGVPADPTSRLITLTDVTGLIVGNTLTGPGILNGSFILEINPAGSPANTVRIEDAVTAQAGSFTSTGSTIGGTTLTIGTLSTGSIVIGQTLTGTGITSGTKITGQISTGSGSGSTWTVSSSQTVTSTAISGTSIYAVTGGLGTYVVDTSVMASNIGGASVNLFDFPEVDNYKILKKIVPEGNNPTFTNGQIITDVITNVPANSATYRRWFVKCRMGVKKRFGTFSTPGDTDFDQGRFPYNPNPVASGSLADLTDVTLTSPITEGDFLWYNGTKWVNENETTVDSELKTLSLTRRYTTANQNYETPITQRLNARVTNAINDNTDDAGPALRFERSSGTKYTKTYVSGGAIGAFTVTLSDVTNLVVGNKVTGTGLPIGNGALITIIAGNQLTLDTAFTVQASGTYTIGAPVGFGQLAFEYTGTTDVHKFIVTTSTDNYLEFPADTYPGTSVLINSSKNSTNINEGILYVNAVNNRIGINNITPAYTLDVTGNAYISDDLTVNGGNINLNGTATAATQPFLTFAAQPDGSNPLYGIRGSSTVDDPWFVGSGSLGDDLGYLEIATGDNAGGANNGGQIYVRQYNNGATAPFGVPWEGGTGVVVNELTLLDNVGNTIIPNNLQVGNQSNQIRATPNNTTTPTGIGAVIAANDFWFVGGYDISGGGSNNGALVIAAGNNGNEPIYVRQYTGPTTPSTTDFPGAAGVNTITNEFTLLDANGNTNIPNNLTVNKVLLVNSKDDVADAAAISLNTASSYFTTGNTLSETATLAAGTEGQFKSLALFSQLITGTTVIVTVTNAGWKSSGTGTITFGAIGDSCLLQYVNGKWFAVGSNSVTFA